MVRSGMLAVMLPLAMAGCTGQDHLGPGFGDAVTHNRVAQIVDPNPVYPGPVTLDGERAGLALKRYRTGTVIPPIDLRTSSVGLQSK